MSQTRGTFIELADNQALDRTVFTLLGKNWQELDPIWKKYFQLKTSKKRSEISMTVLGVGDIPEKPEGQPYTTDIIQKGWDKEYLHTEFGNMFEVTETAREDDRTDVLADHAKWFMFSARVVQEKRAAVFFNNGFSAETTPDGKPIFSTTHLLKGGGSAKNQPSTDADLSWNALNQAIIDWQTDQKFEAGQLMSPAEDLVLLVHPAGEMLADRIVNTTNLPGSADNDRNSIKARRNIKIVVNPYFTDTDAWFLLSAKKDAHGFLSYTRVPMSMKPADTDPRTGNRLYPIRWRQSWGVSWWQGSYGTQGA